MGMVLGRLLGAPAAAGAVIATITSTLSRTSSAASSSSRSTRPSAASVLDDDVPSLHVAQLAASPCWNARSPGRMIGARAEHRMPTRADLSRLLRLGGERRGEEAAS